jgi:hypothetical protein
VDRQPNDRLGRKWRRQRLEYRRKILRAIRSTTDTHSNSYRDPNRDSHSYGNSNAYSYTYGYGETYTNPEDRSHAKSSAHARTAPMSSHAILTVWGRFERLT